MKTTKTVGGPTHLFKQTRRHIANTPKKGHSLPIANPVFIPSFERLKIHHAKTLGGSTHHLNPSR